MVILPEYIDLVQMLLCSLEATYLISAVPENDEGKEVLTVSLYVVGLQRRW